jgi:hypothetical protein
MTSILPARKSSMASGMGEKGMSGNRIQEAGGRKQEAGRRRQGWRA